MDSPITFKIDKKVRLDVLYNWIKKQVAPTLYIYAWVEYPVLNNCIRKRVFDEVWNNPFIDVELKNTFVSYKLNGNKVYSSLFFHRVMDTRSKYEDEIYFPFKPSKIRPPILGNKVYENTSNYYLPEWGPIYVITSAVPNDIYFPEFKLFNKVLIDPVPPLFPSWMSQIKETYYDDGSISRYFTRIISQEIDTNFLDLKSMFEHLIVSEEMPFIKFVNRKFNQGEPLIELYKPILEKYPHMMSILPTWIDRNGGKHFSATGRKRAKGIFEDYLSVKIQLDDTFRLVLKPYFATITIFPNKVIDVTMTLSILDNKKHDFIISTLIPKVNGFLYVLNHILEQTKFLPKLFKPLVYGTDFTDCRALMEKKQKGPNSTSMMRRLDYFFKFPSTHISIDVLYNVIQNKYNDTLVFLENTDESLKFAYKLVNNFASSVNIHKFIYKNFDILSNKNESIKIISDFFSLPPELASMYVEQSKEPNFLKQFKSNKFNFIIITFSYKELQGYLVKVEKCEYFEEIQDISFCLNHIFQSALKYNETNSTQSKLSNLKLNFDLNINNDDDDDENFEDYIEDDKEIQENNDKDSLKNKESQENIIPPYLIINNKSIEQKPFNPKWKPNEGTYINSSSRYVLDNLQQADPELFPKTSGFSTKCQKISNRQPIVVSPNEIRESMNRFPGSVPNYIAHGSSDELAKKNVYFCPDVWCPHDRIAMTRDQFMEQGSCPSGKPGILNFNNSHYSEFDNDRNIIGKKKGYVDLMTINNKCVPCCFKIKPTNTSRCDAEEIKVVDEDMAYNHVHEKNNEKDKYLMKPGIFPVPPSRFGKLSYSLSNLLNTGRIEKDDRKNNLITKNDNLYVRKGVHKHDLLSCIYKDKSEEKFQEIISLLHLKFFIVIAEGKLFRKFQKETEPVSDDEFNQFMETSEGKNVLETVHHPDLKILFEIYKNFQNKISLYDHESLLLIINNAFIIDTYIFVFKEQNTNEGQRTYYNCGDKNHNLIRLNRDIFDGKYILLYQNGDSFEPIIHVQNMLKIHENNRFDANNPQIIYLLDNISKLCKDKPVYKIKSNEKLILDGSARMIGYEKENGELVKEPSYVLLNSLKALNDLHIHFEGTGKITRDSINPTNSSRLRQIKISLLEMMNQNPDIKKSVYDLKQTPQIYSRTERRNILQDVMGLTDNDPLQNIVLEELTHPFIPLDTSFRHVINLKKPRNTNNTLSFKESDVNKHVLQKYLNST
jgi:hypothetical protein